MRRSAPLKLRRHSRCALADPPASVSETNLSLSSFPLPAIPAESSMTSLAQLKKITSPENARLILDMIEGKRDPCEVSAKADAHARSCYSEPWESESIMQAADEILDTHGVEGWVTRVDGSAGVSYCNTGDSYKLTLAYVGGRYSGRFTVSSTATLSERHPERG